MECPCGSGKQISQCHGEGVDLYKLRKQIRNQVEIGNDRRLSFEHILTVENFNDKNFIGTIKLFRTITPAGVILYPTLITSGKKSLRPLSIDGLYFVEDEFNTYQVINCMVTPISSCTVTMVIPKDKPLPMGLSTVKCKIRATGNPFDSVFALETKGDYIALYHHTNEDAKEAIISSRQLRASKWNLQGTRKLENINYIYLTDLPIIEDPLDLAEIGMADLGTRLGMVSDDGIAEYLEVYRDNQLNRKARIKLWVNSDILAPNPLILHDVESNIEVGKYGGFSWWEVFVPCIYRVAVKPESYLPLQISKKSGNIFLKKNEYYVGNQGFLAGYGKDHISMLRLWSEYSAQELIRPNNDYRPSDLGYSDPEWVEVWNRNQAYLVGEVMSETLKKV